MSIDQTNRHRMFVDEVGHAGQGRVRHENDRYLSLSGLIIEQSEYRNVLIPRLDELTRGFFGTKPDGTPIILHRKELLHRKPPFDLLQNEFYAANFDAELLQLIEDVDFKIVTVVLDKVDYLDRFNEWRLHPYNYCMEILAERYVLHLEEMDGTGDIFAEARGKADDGYLQMALGYVTQNGNFYLERERFISRIKPPELRMYPKSANIAGLQLADLLAHPSFIATKLRHQNRALPETFGGRIARALEDSKYRRHNTRIEGYGRKWLP
jgi:hypothetical protein